MARVTLKDVAKKADVSYQTVSKVINGKALISAETETRIWNAIRELGYRPNVAARNLRTQSSNLVGFSWTPDKTLNPIIDRFFYSITQHLRSADRFVLNLPETLGADPYNYRDLYYTGQVSGFILASIGHDDSRVETLIQHNIPFTSFGRANTEWEYAWVDVAGRSGIEQVMDHLIMRGHQRIALFTWPEGSRAGEERERGFFDKMRLAGFPVADGWVRRMLNTVENGYQHAQAILEMKFRPTAIVCVNDMLAIGAMNAIAAAGLEVGRELAVTGFDNIPMTEFLHPALTTVQQPVEEAGNLAATALLAQLDDKRVDRQQVLLQPTLLIRASA